MNPRDDDPTLPTVNSKLTSESSDVLVIFKAPAGSIYAVLTVLQARSGFQLCFKLHEEEGPGEGTDNNTDSGGLSTGVIVGIVVGVVVLAGIGVTIFLIWYCRCRGKNPRERISAKTEGAIPLGDAMVSSGQLSVVLFIVYIYSHEIYI